MIRSWENVIEEMLELESTFFWLWNLDYYVCLWWKWLNLFPYADSFLLVQLMFIWFMPVHCFATHDWFWTFAFDTHLNLLALNVCVTVLNTFPSLLVSYEEFVADCHRCTIFLVLFSSHCITNERKLLLPISLLLLCDICASIMLVKFLSLYLVS